MLADMVTSWCTLQLVELCGAHILAAQTVHSSTEMKMGLTV